MTFKGSQSGKLKFLSESELEHIHANTLRVMQEIGVRFTDNYVRQFFVDGGFTMEGNVVKFRPYQVEDAIRTAPSCFVRHAADPTFDVAMGSGRLYLGGGSAPIYVVEPDTYERRKATFQDVQNFSRLIDGLDNLTVGNGVVYPHDVPESVLHVIWSWNLLNNTRKCANTSHTLAVDKAQDMIRVLSVAHGSLEAFKQSKRWTTTCCPDQALSWGDTLVGLVEMAKVESPIVIMSMPLMGAMHPVTIAGALVQANAEVLGAIVLAQLVNPGAPVIYTYYGGLMDMRTGISSFGAPEVALCHTAGVQLAKWYGLPCDVGVGHTDSKVPDAQAAYEKMMSMLPAALAGADNMRLIGGELDFGLSASYEEMVIDNEIAGNVLRMVSGIEVSKETLALDAMKEVGPGGNYLAHPHTLHNFRRATWMPTLADRQSRDMWEASGAKPIGVRARERAAEILATHHPKPISAERRQAVAAVIREICEREGVLQWWEEVGSQCGAA